MRLIALDTDRSLRDMISVFHYAYIDDMTAGLVAEIIYDSIKEDLGYSVEISETNFSLLMSHIVKESLSNYIDTVLKAIVHQSTHSVLEALTNNKRISIQMDTKIHEPEVVSYLFNSILQDMAYVIGLENILYRSMAVVLDRLKEKNVNNLTARTMQFINTVQPQLQHEPISHVIRTELINGRTVAVMVS